MNADAAYQVCEQITRREAKNFSYGIRLLRPPERAALSAVYAFARRVDDVGDGDAAAGWKLETLERYRADLAALGSGEGLPRSDDAVLVALHDAWRRYELPLGAFGELIDGCESDVRGVRILGEEDLVRYCRQVAGSIGRLSLAVFGSDDPAQADQLADALGVALQLTNILRDVVEDRQMGRVYLPAEDAARFELPPDLQAPPAEVAELVAFECARARRWFDEGMRLLPLLERRSRACVGAMAGIYRRLLSRIEADPLAVTRGRLSLPAWEKAWVAGAALVGRTP